MNTPETPHSFRARVREYLRALAFNILDLHHRLFDPLDPKSLPDYRKELELDFNDEDATHNARQTPRRS